MFRPAPLSAHPSPSTRGAFCVRPAARAAAPSSSHRRPASRASAAHSTRGTLLVSPWNIRSFVSYSAQVSPSKTEVLVRKFVRIASALRRVAGALLSEAAANQRVSVGGGLRAEGATCGVTGRRSRVCRDWTILPAVDKRFLLSCLGLFLSDLVRHFVRILCLTSSQGKAVEHPVFGRGTFAPLRLAGMLASRSFPLRDEALRVFRVNRAHEVRHLVPQRRSEPDQRREARHLHANLQVADVRPRHIGRFRERLNRHSALVAKLLQSGSEDRRFTSSSLCGARFRHLILRLL